MLQATELISLGINALLFFFLYHILKRHGLRVPPMLKFALFFMLLSGGFTILEDFVANDVFNFLEHLSFTIGCLFLLLSALKEARIFDR
jgi:hypothetical protein